jgi:agmatinase
MDFATMYRPGARFGPRGIRDASGGLRPHDWRPGEIEAPYDKLRVVDYGDLEVYPGYIEQTMDRLLEQLAPIVEAEVFPVVLGGDHSSSLPVLRALAQQHGKMSLVHFDAHPDYWKGPEGRPYHHGTPFRIATEEGLIDPEASVQVGIRGSISANLIAEARAAGFHLLTADEFARQGVRVTVEAIQRIATLPVYVSLDIDCVDPAFAPGTGTPEVAGLTSREIVELVRGLSGLPFVGFDVVEVAPAYDSGEITALLAANLVHEFLMLLRERA